MNTLVDEIMDMVTEASARGMYPVFTDAASDLLGRSCLSEDGEADLFTKIADRIEREYLPLPMLEGEPLNVGDKVDGYSQEGAEVVAIMNSEMIVVRSTVKGGNGYHDEAYPLLLWSVKDVKRPHPEVLDADGVPIHVGDTVYLYGDACEVTEINKYGISGKVLEFKPGYRTDFHNNDPLKFTHKQPDTLERIEEDARKAYEWYWGCNCMLSCKDCPALIDGKKPHERYATGGDCMRAQYLDLMRRQREVLEMGQA